MKEEDYKPEGAIAWAGCLIVALIIVLFAPPIFNYFTANRDIKVIVGTH